MRETSKRAPAVLPLRPQPTGSLAQPRHAPCPHCGDTGVAVRTSPTRHYGQCPCGQPMGGPGVWPCQQCGETGPCRPACPAAVAQGVALLHDRCLLCAGAGAVRSGGSHRACPGPVPA